MLRVRRLRKPRGRREENRVSVAGVIVGVGVGGGVGGGGEGRRIERAGISVRYWPPEPCLNF